MTVSRAPRSKLSKEWAQAHENWSALGLQPEVLETVVDVVQLYVDEVSGLVYVNAAL